MTTDRELMQQALDALLFTAKACSTCQEGADSEYCCRKQQWEAIEALRARLAQPEPKPVGCITEVHTKTSYGGTVGKEPQMYSYLPAGTLLYTAPPQREWQGLTDEDVKNIVFVERSWADAVRKVEAKLKEKNT